MALIITVQYPAVIAHHCIITKTLVAFLHCLYILVKFFTLLITDRTKVCGKNSRLSVENAFRDMRQPISLYDLSWFLTSSRNKGNIILSKKFPHSHSNAFQAHCSNAISVFSKFGSFKTFRICRPTKIPSSILLHLFWETSCKEIRTHWNCSSPVL